MSVAAHERFGKLKCGRCPALTRSLLGCPFPIAEADRAQFGGTYQPTPRETWPHHVVRLANGTRWEVAGCPWASLVEDERLVGWVNAWELLKRFGKTPVDLGVWPRITAEYVDVMLELDRLSDAVTEDRVKRERDELRRQVAGGR